MPVVWGIALLVLAFTGSMDGKQDASPQAPAAPSVAPVTPAAPVTPVTPPVPVTPAADGPTLKETTDWLGSHLVGVIHTSRRTAVTLRAKKGKEAKQEPKEVDRQAINTHESVSMTNFDGCAMTLGQLTKGDDYTVVTVSQIPLNSLSNASWKVIKHEPVKTQNGLDSTEVSILPASQAVITLEASTTAITWKRKSSGSVPLDQDALPYEGKGRTLVINSDDEAMPPRLVKAFNHAIQLCHVNVKPEPF